MKGAIDLDGIERRARDGALPALIDELAASADAAMRLLARALKLDLTVLSSHPELVYPCLVRRGYWSAAEAAAFLAGNPAGGAAASPLRPLLEAWRPRGRGPWLRALRPLRVSLDGALREEYRGDLSGGAPVLAGDAVGARGAGGVVAWDRRSGARLSHAEIASRLPDDAPARFALKRGGGWGRCDLIDGLTGRARKVRVDGDSSFDCAVDAPGGHAIAAGWFCDYNGVIVRLDPAAARVVWRTDVVHWIQSLAISADGELLLAGDGTCHHLLDAGSGHVLGRLDVAGAVGFSPDGREIALRHGDALQIWDLDGIRRGDHLASVPHGLVDAAFAPGGARLLTGGLLCDGDTGQPVSALAVDPGHYLEGGPPAHGRRLTDRLFIEASPLGGLRAWDAATGELVLRDPHRRYRIGDLIAISPEGERYAVSRGRGSGLAIREVSDGAELGRVDLPVAGAVVFSADGSRIALATDAGEVWTVDRGGADLTHVGQHPCGVQELAFAHDGSLLASRDMKRRVRVWEPRRGLVAEREDADWRPLADSIDGWAGFRAHAHPLRCRTSAGLAEIVDERSGRVIARIPADDELVPDAQGRRWASREAHHALEDLTP